MGKTTVAAAGILANLMFWPALFIFAALRPDYSHFTKAVSELGTWGAPRMWQFNTIGYIIPGALIAYCGWGLGRLIAPRGIVLPVLLLVPGLGLLISGVFPGDLDHRESLTTLLHLSGSLIGFTIVVAWIVLAFRLGGEWRGIALLSILALFAFIGVFALYAVAPTLVEPRPGLSQRLLFAVWLGWYLGASLVLLNKREAAR